MRTRWLAPSAVGYVIGITVAGFVIGLLVGWAIMGGPLRFLATHRWAYDLVNKKRRGIVATYVATTTKEEGRVLMYSGYLSEFYLDAGGWFTHLVMRDCSSYYMKLGGDKPSTHERRKLFKEEGDRQWDHLVLPGSAIANVLFEPLGKLGGEIEVNAKTLDELLRPLQDDIERVPASSDSTPH